METISENLVGIGEYFGESYAPVLDFHGWRVAMLRSGEHTSADAFHRIERHRETNEVFMLTTGMADLIIFDGGDQPTTSTVIPMRLNVAYNVQQAVWHHAVLSADAHIVIFERTDTTRENSDYYELSQEQIAEIKQQFKVGSNR